MAIETGWILAKAITGEIALAQYLEVPSNDENTVAIEVPNDNIFQAVLKDPSKYYYSFEFSCILSKTQEQIATEKTTSTREDNEATLVTLYTRLYGAEQAGLTDRANNIREKIATYISKFEPEIAVKIKKQRLKNAILEKLTIDATNADDEVAAIDIEIDSLMAELNKTPGRVRFYGVEIDYTGLKVKGKSAVEADIEFSNNEKGSIYISPNGTKYRLTIGDGGQVQTNEVI